MNVLCTQKSVLARVCPPGVCVCVCVCVFYGMCVHVMGRVCVLVLQEHQTPRMGLTLEIYFFLSLDTSLSYY